MPSELLYPAAFIAGFVGSGHCIGMCGPVVMLLEQDRPTDLSGMARRIIYNTGRLSFYVLLGAIAGGFGVVLSRIAGIDTTLMVLRLAASLLVIAIGLNLVFNLQALRLLEKGGSVIWRRMSPLARHVLPITTAPRAFGAGFIWGALPCGLVYSSVAIAAASGSMLHGGLVMLAFWLGTLPTLLIAGTSASALTRWQSKPALRIIAGLVLISLGVVALAMPYLIGSTHQHA